MRRRTARILTGIAVILITLGVVYAIVVAISATRLRRAYIALEKDGQPMEMTSVIPPEIPDTNNAALLYESAALLLRAEPAPEKDLLGYLGTLARKAEKEGLDAGEQSEFDDLLRLDVVDQALSIIERGTQRPACRFENDYTAGLAIRLSHLSQMHTLGRILGGKALLQAREGQTDEAWRTVLVQLAFADGLQAEPILVSQLVRASQISETCATIKGLCERSLPNERQSLGLRDLLGRYDDVNPLIRAVDGERLIFGEQTFRLPKNELSQVVGDMRGDDDMLGITSRLMLLRVFFKPLFLADHAAYLRWMHNCTRQFSTPFDPNEAEVFDREFTEINKRHVITGILMPAMARVKAVYLQAIANVRITKAGLALLQYKTTHGSLPETLDVLEAKNTSDPFCDGNLVYQRAGIGFTLYSVGPDQKDNSGAAKQPRQETDYDIVWHFPGQ